MTISRQTLEVLWSLLNTATLSVAGDDFEDQAPVFAIAKRELREALCAVDFIDMPIDVLSDPDHGSLQGVDPLNEQPDDLAVAHGHLLAIGDHGQGGGVGGEHGGPKVGSDVVGKAHPAIIAADT